MALFSSQFQNISGDVNALGARLSDMWTIALSRLPGSVMNRKQISPTLPTLMHFSRVALDEGKTPIHCLGASSLEGRHSLIVKLDITSDGAHSRRPTGRQERAGS